MFSYNLVVIFKILFITKTWISEYNSLREEEGNSENLIILCYCLLLCKELDWNKVFRLPTTYCMSNKEGPLFRSFPTLTIQYLKEE